jgi:hypothetical protein
MEQGSFHRCYKSKLHYIFEKGKLQRKLGIAKDDGSDAIKNLGRGKGEKNGERVKKIRP